MSHEQFMREALRLARRGLGRTSPNPVVGSVVVKKGAIIGRGYHKKAGLPHAEIEALAGLNTTELKGAVLYITLEPCCHKGRTGACTEAIIASGIKKVVVGAADPNPLVSGKGVLALRSAGIEVIEGVLAQKAGELNESFEKFITTGMPFVTLKLGASLDGRIAASTGESEWITGQASRKYVHRLRALADAVMVGAETVIIDDPALTVRHVRGSNPVRVVLDSSLRIPLTAEIFKDTSSGLIIFTTRKADKEKVRLARVRGARVFYVPSQAAGGVDLKRVIKKLGECSITNLLVEGGGSVAASLVKAGLVDRVLYFIAPILLGADSVAAIGALSVTSPLKAPRFTGMRVKRIGDDLLVEGSLQINSTHGKGA